MRISGDSVGPRGLALLLVTAVAGIVLAVHGWSGRQSKLTPGALGGPGSPVPARSSASPSPASSFSPRRSPSPASSSSPRGSPTAPATAGRSTGTHAAKAGPLLSSQSYASYSFLVWPGTPSAASKAAMTGLSISVRHTSSGISVRAGVTGQPQSAAHLYTTGVRVYVIEASLGDDAANTDYNLGDDGVVVTDASGRIVP
jgi:hypothetical protein